LEAWVKTLPARTIVHVAVTDSGYEVEWFVARHGQQVDFIGDSELEAAKKELCAPPRFTYETDPCGCERMANARGKRN
jgi:hypothetical protein